MTDFIIKKLPYDLSSHAGLAFIDKYLKRVNVNCLIDPKFPEKHGVKTKHGVPHFPFHFSFPFSYSFLNP